MPAYVYTSHLAVLPLLSVFTLSLFNLSVTVLKLFTNVCELWDLSHFRHPVWVYGTRDHRMADPGIQTAINVQYKRYAPSVGYIETNVMHLSFNWLRIMGLYMFRALLAHPQESLHSSTWYITCVLCQLAALSYHLRPNTAGWAAGRRLQKDNLSLRLEQNNSLVYAD
jgi:hypothetical protein